MLTSSKKKRYVVRTTSKPITSPDKARSVTTASVNRVERLHERVTRLAPWLALANLLPPPPARAQLVKADRLACHLLIDAWRENCRAQSPVEFIARIEHCGLAHSPAFAAWLDWPVLQSDPEQAGALMSLAIEIAGALQGIAGATASGAVKAAGAEPLRLHVLYLTRGIARSEIWLRAGRIASHWAAPFCDFLTALEGFEAACLRQCAVCSRFFAALRKDQKACSKRCNTSRRVRQWRMHQALYEYRRKLRGAGLAPPAKRRPKLT